MLESLNGSKGGLIVLCVLISGLGGTGLGTLAGGARAEQKLSEHSKMIGVLETKIDGLVQRLNDYGEAVKDARVETRDASTRIRQIENATTRILTILEEREK